jgi:hypothetical protein
VAPPVWNPVEISAVAIGEFDMSQYAVQPSAPPEEDIEVYTKVV